MTSCYVDLHVLQTIPPSNVNRDETGSPKTATYGGVARARVSSQAWKKAVRRDFAEHLDQSEIGVRSKRLVARIAENILRLAPHATPQEADELAASVLAALDIKVERPKRSKKAVEQDAEEGSPESGYLIFLSNRQVENLAEHAVGLAGQKPAKRQVAALAQKDHSFDIALFGRMVADITDLKVDAAAQVAHAISVHAVENEFDYFTAVDDHATGDHAGAGMIGTVEFNSSTLYRYATVNVDRLHQHLGDPAATRRALEAFVVAFVRSLPTGKQNTFANRTLPHAVVATVRTDQPINLVGAFETPADGTAGRSRLAAAATALVEHTQLIDAAYGRPDDTQSWVTTASAEMAPLHQLGTEVDLAGLQAAVGAVAQSLVDAS